MASGRLGSLLAYNKSFKCTDVRVGDTALLHKAVDRKITPRWRRQAKIGAVNFQSRAFKAARLCVRKKVEEKDAEEADWGITWKLPRGA